MKKLLALFTAGILSLQANAGLFSSAITNSWDTKTPTGKYLLSTYGYDVRVYEWTPKDNKDVTCVFVAGQENSSGVACYPKKTKK